jgi:hypothetical protein
MATVFSAEQELRQALELPAAALPLLQFEDPPLLEVVVVPSVVELEEVDWPLAPFLWGGEGGGHRESAGQSASQDGQAVGQ